MKTRLAFQTLILIAAMATDAGCSQGPVVIITNQSSVTLSNVVVSGSGFSNRIESIAAGGVRRLTVHPKGESALRVAFDAGTQRVEASDLAYIEAGGHYRVTATVSSNLSVSASSDLQP